MKSKLITLAVLSDSRASPPKKKNLIQKNPHKNPTVNPTLESLTKIIIIMNRKENQDGEELTCFPLAHSAEPQNSD